MRVVETWGDFSSKLREKCFKVELYSDNKEKVEIIPEYIKGYLNNNKIECIRPIEIGYKSIFQGFIIKK